VLVVRLVLAGGDSLLLNSVYSLTPRTRVRHIKVIAALLCRELSIGILRDEVPEDGCLTVKGACLLVRPSQDACGLFGLVCC
jgi:hypothetical protein